MKRLTIGRGMNLRITKAGRAAEERFDALVIEHLKSIGATPPEADAVRDRTWTVQTIHGRLLVTPYGDWIAQRFADWPETYDACMKHARERGFDHWKWNFHYELSEEPCVLDWQAALGRILPATAQAVAVGQS